MPNNVPNNAQAARIERDVTNPRDWFGNSYRATSRASGMTYVHWNTTIAETTDGRLTYFDARYISTTTRGFQSRIVAGLDAAGIDVSAAQAELAKPTHERDRLTLA